MILTSATSADVDAVTDLFITSRAQLTYLPSLPPREDVAGFLSRVIDTETVRLAKDGTTLLGFSAEEPGWLNHLYIAPSAFRQGIGTTLWREVRAAQAGPVQCWCFQDNAPALAFYEAHGFVEVTRTDGANNMERSPDVLLEHRL